AAVDLGLVGGDGVAGGRVDHVAGLHVELAPVARAHDRRVLELALRERALPVRARVVEGVEGAADVRHRHRDAVGIERANLTVGDVVRASEREELGHGLAPSVSSLVVWWPDARRVAATAPTMQAALAAPGG